MGTITTKMRTQNNYLMASLWFFAKATILCYKYSKSCLNLGQYNVVTFKNFIEVLLQSMPSFSKVLNILEM